MARVKIKSDNTKDPRRTSKLLEILSTNDVYVTRLIPVNDGFIVLTSGDNELDKIFNNTTDKLLEENDFTPQIPPELSANRSVLLFKVDNHIFGNSERDIKTEIETRNDWVGKVTRVYKFPKGNIMKITFNEAQKAKKALDIGLKMFSMKVAKYDIRQDTHINILTCLKCYKMEDHTTGQCNHDQTYKICSECSSRDHTWRDCPGGAKKCLSCGGPHSTLAMRCPKRKEIITQKRKEEKERDSETYTNIVKRNTAQVQVIHPQPITTTGSDSSHSTIYQAMLHSHFSNIGNPGSYANTFNNLMKAHNLPTLNIQEDPPSLEIIARLSEEEGKRRTIRTDTVQSVAHQIEKQQQRKGEQEQQEKRQQEQQRQVEQHVEQQEINMETEKQVEEQAVKPRPPRYQERKQRKSLSRITGTDIGLKIYTTKTRGWVEVPMRKNSLLKGIEDKIIKWTYTDQNIKEKEIMEKFVFGQIDLTDCFHLTEEDTFRKIKTGLLEERSPPPRPEKQRKESI